MSKDKGDPCGGEMMMLTWGNESVTIHNRKLAETLTALVDGWNQRGSIDVLLRAAISVAVDQDARRVIEEQRAAWIDICKGD